MLHRSFKAGKCKTSLKLAVARIKLLKNKREVQIKQMKRDLAHLLETGQEKTAMIRVEHVVREEKTMAAYDFLDIYCELIVARLPIIESQKKCPIDLKEAVSSIVFASPRCADIPELLDARKHFTAKYGKDFITSALELRPDCGVNRTVVENLSARAPDGQTKLKILTGIAQEYNVDWDAKAFGEKELKPPEDLLNGPRVIGSDSGRPAEPLGAQLPPYGQKPELSSVKNVTESSQSSQLSDPTNIRTPSMTTHTSTEPRTSGTGSAAEGREFERPSSQSVNQFTPNRQNWNMNFKDATSAAQAAAESAERASLAARAAAELSGYKIPRQFSTGSHEQYSTGSHEQYSTGSQQRYPNERESNQGLSDSMATSQDHTRRRPGHSASSGSGMPKVEDDTERTDVYCQNWSSEVEVNNSWQAKPEGSEVQSSHFGAESADHQHMKRSGHTNSTKEGIRRQSSDTLSSVSDDVDDVPSVSNLHKYGKDGLGHSFVGTAEGSEVQESYIEVESVDHDQYNQRSGHTNSLKEGTRSQSRESFSSSSDDNGDFTSVLNLDKNGWDGHDHLFIDTAEGSTQSGTKQPSFDDYPSAVFDESVFYNETTGHKYGLYNPSPGSNLPSQFSDNADIWSPGRHKNDLPVETPTHSPFTKESYPPHEFSESINKTPSPAQSGDLLPATFDDSDGLDSDSEEETVNAEPSGRKESSNQLHKNNSTMSSESTERVISSFTEKETKVINTKPLLHSSSDDSDSDSAYPARNQETKINAGSETWKKNQNLSDFPNVQPSAGHMGTSSSFVDDKAMSSRYSLTEGFKTGGDFVPPGSPDKVEYSEISSYLSSESGNDLGFGRLRGGFRNKGYTRPPYRKDLSVDNSAVLKQQETEDTTEQLMVSSVVRTKSNTEVLHGQRPYAHVRKEMNSPRTTSETLYDQRPHSYGHKDASSSSPRTIFDSDSDDAEVLPRQTSGSRGKSGRVSHRTRESRAVSDVNSLSTSTSGSRMAVNADREEFMPNISNAIVTPSNPQNARSTGSRRSIRTNFSGEQKPDPQLQSRRGDTTKLAGANMSVEQQPSKSTPSTKYSPHNENLESSRSSTVEQTSTNAPSGSGSVESGSRRSIRTNFSGEQKPDPQLQSRRGDTTKLAGANMSVEQQPSKSTPSTKYSPHNENLKTSRSSAVEQTSTNAPSGSGSVESLKRSSLNKESPSKENSLKKAGHVHPKLPDYDTFAAHFESLRSNR